MGHSIGRLELSSCSPSIERSSPSPSLEKRLKEQLVAIYGTTSLDGRNGDGSSDQAATDTSVVKAEENNEDEYEFRLFAKPSTKSTESTTATRIVIRSPTPVHGEPGFVKPRRPDTYYFAGYAHGELMEHYRSAAVTGEHIVEGLNVPWVCPQVYTEGLLCLRILQPGCELPWRVVTIHAVDARKGSNSTRTTDATSHKRKRIGKKRRIMIRKKTATKKEEESAAKQDRAEKEAAEREKRTRRNREKKVKKKRKEKLKKSDVTEERG